MNTETLDSPETKTAQQRRDDRKVVTPYAFGVADHLIGTRLASPMRRGTAILIDLLCIALLTNINSLILAGLVAWAFFRAGNRIKKKKRFNFARIVLRFFAALLLFVFAMGVIEYAQEASFGGSEDVSKSTGIEGMERVEALALLAKYAGQSWLTMQKIEDGECQPELDCWLTVAENLGTDIAKVGTSEQAFQDLMVEISAKYSEVLDDQALAKFEQRTKDSFLKTREQNPLPLNSEDLGTENAQADSLQQPEGSQAEANEPGLLDWMFAIADDFGIGFGWAAFYFSVFGAWWKGQTPGKKLLGIRVLKLDGNPLNLWESFERYGGYAAGLVTGLLGFLQIFWDANRQGIQDKIAETVVIRISSDGAALKKGLKAGA